MFFPLFILKDTWKDPLFFFFFLFKYVLSNQSWRRNKKYSVAFSFQEGRDDKTDRAGSVLLKSLKTPSWPRMFSSTFKRKIWMCVFPAYPPLDLTVFLCVCSSELRSPLKLASQMSISPLWTRIRALRPKPPGRWDASCAGGASLELSPYRCHFCVSSDPACTRN